MIPGLEVDRVLGLTYTYCLLDWGAPKIWGPCAVGQFWPPLSTGLVRRLLYRQLWHFILYLAVAPHVRVIIWEAPVLSTLSLSALSVPFPPS